MVESYVSVEGQWEDPGTLAESGPSQQVNTGDASLDERVQF